MRLNVHQFVQLIESIFDLPEPIYEFGSLQVTGQEAIADLRPLFSGKKYVGCDILLGKGVDRIENVEAINLVSESIGTVIFVETIEHVIHPHRAISEIYRILKSGGVLVITSAMDLPIHSYPYDLWRFTPDGFRQLLSLFPQGIIGYQGFELEPHTIFGIGFKSQKKDVVSGFRDLVSRSYTEVKTGNAPKAYKRKIALKLMKIPLIKRRNYLFDILNRYISTDNIHFELVSTVLDSSRSPG